MLSHGQSSIKRGFSTSKDIVEDNMNKATLEGFRRVYDGLKQFELDLADTPISKRMLDTCRGARSRYQQFLDEEKKKKTASQAEVKKPALKDDIKAEKERKGKSESNIGVLTKEADELAKQAEKKMKMVLLVKSNAFREKIKEKRKEVEESDEKIKCADKKLQQM